MANINKELNQIKNAVYGREVRGSIHDGIEKINEETEKATELTADTKRRQESVEQQFDDLQNDYSNDSPSDAEIVAARTNAETSENHSTIGRRMDAEYKKVTSQLAKTDHQTFNSNAINRWDNAGPMITIHDDDGNRGFYTKVFEVAKEYNIPITSAIITNRAMGFPGDERPYNNRYYHYTEVMDMKESGLVEFVSHTHNHPLNMNDESRELLHEEFVDSRNFMKKWGMNHRVVVIPGGHINDKVIEEARQVYEYMTTYGGLNKVVSPPFSNYEIPRVNFDQDIDSVKSYIDEAYEKNAWIILRTHVDQAESYSNEKFREIIEYAQSLDFKFVTTEEGIRHHSNILEIKRNEVISADGEIHSDRLGKVVVDKSSSITGDTPITYFTPETVTHSIVRASQDGFPGVSNEIGLLETIRMSENEKRWSAQKYYPLRTEINTEYIRYWDETTDNWTKWENITPLLYLGPNTVRSSDGPDDNKLKNRITHCKIDVNNTEVESFPEGKLGLLVTHSLTQDNFSYQEYGILKESTVYKRDWDNSKKEWGNWYLKTSRILGKLNEISPDDKPRDFPSGITINRSASNRFISGGASGVIRTTMFITDEAFWAKQEFFENHSSGNEPKMYIRTGNTDNTWSEWRRIVTESV